MKIQRLRSSTPEMKLARFKIGTKTTGSGAGRFLIYRHGRQEHGHQGARAPRDLLGSDGWDGNQRPKVLVLVAVPGDRGGR